jgi:hypothetical protein
MNSRRNKSFDQSDFRARDHFRTCVPVGNLPGLLGGETLGPFSLALLMGIMFGTYHHRRGRPDHGLVGVADGCI